MMSNKACERNAEIATLTRHPSTLRWQISHMDSRPIEIQTRSGVLRSFKECDKQDRINAGFDVEFFRALGVELSEEIDLETFAEEWFEKKTNPEHSWAIEVDGICVGSIWIHSIEKKNKRGRFAIEIHHPGYWNRGIGEDATRAVVQFAFEELKLHRLDLRVLKSNHRAIRCYEKCGFVREGIQRETVLIHGVWESDLWMSILESEYNQDANKAVERTR